MKLMVIGGGGREHAIIKKLKENPAVEVIYCLPGNGGIAADAVCVSEIGAKDIPAQVEFARAHGIDYAVVEFSTDSACCVVLASEGYPKKYESGFAITMSEEAAAHTYVAGAKKDGDALLTAGGRVLGVTAVAPTLERAVQEAYRLAGEVKFANKYCRSDIGRKALAAQKERE